MKQPQLLPAPSQLKFHNGAFRLRADTAITLNRIAPEAALHIAEDLQQFIKQATGLQLGIEKIADNTPHPNSIFLQFAPPSTGSMEAYSLAVTQQNIHLKSGTPLGLRWAERTLRQIIAQSGKNLPSVKIEDEPKMRFRGVMLDIARGKVPTLDTLFELTEQMSFYKLNALQLYTEHTFAFRHHPLIGKNAGRLTSEDILRLDAHCRRLGVDLMPCLQSFGHMYWVLSLPPYQHLAELPATPGMNPDRGLTITPAREESCQLLESLFDDFLPSFSSGFCNINCDETYDLGKGQSKIEAERIGVGRLYLQHILRLHKIITGKHGRRMMMWGDIILNHPELVAELPKDVIVMNWGYEATHKFESSKLFADTGLTHWVCPGTSTWNTIFPRINNACGNVRGFVAAGHEHRAAGMLNTDWGDGGHYNLQGHSWHSYLYGAECSWSGTPRNDRAFDDAFGRNFFGKGGEKIARAFRQLGSLNDNADMMMGNQSRSLHMLFNHPGGTAKPEDDRLAPLTPAALRHVLRVAESCSKTFASAAKNWRASVPASHHKKNPLNILARGDARPPATEPHQTLLECQLAADLLVFAARKTLFLKNAPRSSLLAPRSVRRLISQQRALVTRFKKLWLARSKPNGMEIALSRFAKEERYLRQLTR